MIVRDEHNGKKGFVILSQSIFRAGLSAHALALLCYALSLPDDWQFTAEGLLDAFPFGKKQLRHTLAELAEKGYVRVAQERASNGRYGRPSMTFYETPHPEETRLPSGFSPCDRKPRTVGTADGEDREPCEPRAVKEPQPNNKKLNQIPKNGPNIFFGAAASAPQNKKSARASFESASEEDAAAYREKMGYESDPKAFVAYHAMHGWKDVRNWKRAYDYWELGFPGNRQNARAPSSEGRLDFDLDALCEKPKAAADSA